MLRKLWFNLAYLRRPIWDTGVSPQELLDFIAAHPPGRALDLGCGTGTNLVTLARHGWQVTGVDFSRGAIRKAREKARQNQVDVDLRVDDVTHLHGLLGKFDLVLDMGCFHSLPASQHSAYVDQIAELLSDAGTFLLYTFIKAGSSAAAPGIIEADIRYFDQKLVIVSRKDSTERGLRPSAWLTIQKRRINETA